MDHQLFRYTDASGQGPTRTKRFGSTGATVSVSCVCQVDEHFSEFSQQAGPLGYRDTCSDAVYQGWENRGTDERGYYPDDDSSTTTVTTASTISNNNAMLHHDDEQYRIEEEEHAAYKEKIIEAVCGLPYLSSMLSSEGAVDEDEESLDREESTLEESSGRLELVKRLWKELVRRPMHTLYLPRELCLDSMCVNYMLLQMQKIPAEKRPLRIVLESEVDTDASDRLARLVSLCQATLRDLVIQNRKCGLPRSSERVYNRVLGSAYSLTSLESMSLSRVFLSPVATKGLAQTLLSGWCTIRSLSITRTLIFHMSGLAGALGSYGALEELSFGGCEMGDEKLLILAEGLAKSPSRLTKLNLSGNDLSNVAFPGIAGILEGQPSLTVLNLSRNMIFLSEVNEDMCRFLKALSRHGSLQDLRLNNCGLDTVTMGPLLPALMKSSSLLFFQLACPLNAISREEEWADSLPRMRRLRSKLVTAYFTSLEGDDGSIHESEPGKVYELEGCEPVCQNVDMKKLRALSADTMLRQITIHMEPYKKSFFWWPWNLFFNRKK